MSFFLLNTCGGISPRAAVGLTTALTAGILAFATPVRAQSTDDTTESTEAAPAADVVLDGIVLYAQPATTTEDSLSWTTDWMRSATGLILSQKETPQSVSVITQQQMKDRNITTVSETMDAATGITVQAFESDRINYYARGFRVDAYQFDGAPIPRDGTWQFGDNNADMALYDHVEIVRGATGLMTGAGEPGASINFIRKRPTDTLRQELAFSLASPNGARLEADYSAPLNAEGTIRGRLVGVWDRREGALDGYEKEKLVGYGVIEADLSASTVLSVGVSQQRTEADNVTWGGLPPFDSAGNLIDWDWGSNLGADWTYNDTDRAEVFASLEHEFTNGWKGRLMYTHVENDFDSELAWISGTPDAVTGEGMGGWAAKYKGGYKQDALNAMLNGDFEAFGRNHQFVLGGYYSDGSGLYKGYNVDNASLAPVGNVFDWDGSWRQPVFSSTANSVWRSKVEQIGLYGTVHLRATDALAVLAGARLNWWDGTESNPGSPVFSYSHNGIVTPYLGFTYDFNDTYTGYGSITSIYKPQLVQDIDRNYLEPTYGYNYELGLKASLADGAINASAAVFQTNQKDVANYVGFIEEENRSVYESIEGTTTRGFEVEIAGALTDRWNGSLGFTHRKSEDRDGNALYVDQPRDTIKLATDYRVAALGDKLRLGGAMRWQSGTDSMAWEGDTANVRQKSYAVFDASAAWDFSDTMTLSLSVTNLLDEKYYATTGFYNTVVYGDGRAAEVTLRAKF